MKKINNQNHGSGGLNDRSDSMHQKKSVQVEKTNISQNHRFKGLKDDTDLKSVQSEQSSKSVIQTTVTTKPFYNSTIPNDWELMSLNLLGKFSKGKGILKEQVSESGLPCIRYGKIYTTRDFIIKKFKSFISEDVAQESNKIKNGDILFAGSGETIEEIGKAVAFIGNEKAYAGGDVIILSTNEKVNAECLSYILETDIARRQKRRLGQGNSVVHIYPSDLATLKLPFPSLPEQKAIAHILSLMDTAINKINLLIAKKELQKKWLMQNLLTGKKRLKGFEKEKWKEVRLYDVAEIDKSSLGNHAPDDYSFQYLSLSDVDFGSAEIKSERIIFSDAPSRARRIVRKGDVLLATVRLNLQGFVIIRDDVKDLIASTGFAVITCTKINNEFLYQYLFTRNLMKQIESFLVGSNYPAINSSDVKNLRIPFPCKEEQTAISRIMQTADKEIQLLKTKTEKLREQKKGMMQVLLTGKKRLKL